MDEGRKIKEDVIIHYCSNCEENDQPIAKFYCRNCYEEYQRIVNSSLSSSSSSSLISQDMNEKKDEMRTIYFCTGCSLIHPKIKCFRGHHILPLYNEDKILMKKISLQISILSSTLNNGVNSMIEAYLTIHDFIEDYLDWRGNNLTSTLLVIGIIVIYFTFVKMLFGRITTLAHIAVLVIFNRYLVSNRKISKPSNTSTERFSSSFSFKIPDYLKSKMNCIRHPRTKIEEDNPPMRNKFWDESEFNRPTSRTGNGIIRPRTRVYGNRMTKVD